MHIGLIGGIGPAATDYYYRGLIERHAKSNTTLDLIIVHADLRQLAQNRADRNAQRQAEIFLRLIQRLAAAGTELAAITSMGGHFYVEELKKISPLPILNAIPEVEAAVRRRNLKTVGILGTRAVMETALYGGSPPPRLSCRKATHSRRWTTTMPRWRVRVASPRRSGAFSFRSGGNYVRYRAPRPARMAAGGAWFAGRGRGGSARRCTPDPRRARGPAPRPVPPSARARRPPPAHRDRRSAQPEQPGCAIRSRADSWHLMIPQERLQSPPRAA